MLLIDATISDFRLNDSRFQIVTFVCFFRLMSRLAPKLADLQCDTCTTKICCTVPLYNLTSLLKKYIFCFLNSVTKLKIKNSKTGNEKVINRFQMKSKITQKKIDFSLKDLNSWEAQE